MAMLPLKIGKSLEIRKTTSSFRELKFSQGLVDFASNDYLGLASKEEIFNRAGEVLKEHDMKRNGSGGSRLLTGNHSLYPHAESLVANYHKAEAALIFNSGYDANIGLFSALPGRGDIIFYDELVHASIRDGLRLSMGRPVKFVHNDLSDLQKKLNRIKRNESGTIFLVTETIFSMDGDGPDLQELVKFTQVNNLQLILDEAHSTGLNGPGQLVSLGLQDKVLARLVTFGKAIGAHGSAVLGSEKLKEFLINYARSFIYSTSLPPHSVATIISAYQYLDKTGDAEIGRLQDNLEHFRSEILNKGIEKYFIQSQSPIHCCIIAGNEKVRKASQALETSGFDVRPILSPTVPKGQERLRICLHSFNTKEEISQLVETLEHLLDE